MFFALHTFWVCLGLFIAMLLLLELGRWVGRRRLQQDPDGAKLGFGAIEGAVFGLLGLLIAFTFSGAASRFDVRRQLIIEETNAIGTAYLRLDLLPAEAQPGLRDCFRQYLDIRLEAYRKLPDLQAAMKEIAKGSEMQKEIWRRAVAACETGKYPQATILLMPALNQMFDITTTRTMAGQIHPPAIVFIMLASLALAGALMAGHGMAAGKTRSWVHVLCFAAIMAVTVYVIIDIEYPRLGFINVKAFDQALVDLRTSMK